MPPGRITRIALTTVLTLGLLVVPGPGAETARAAAPTPQDVPPPPGLGATLLHASLSVPEVFEPGTCPTGAARGEYVEEGFMLTVQGRCVTGAGAANLPVPARQIVVWDGDVALDFKVAAGMERAGVNLYARIRNSSNLMSAYLNLATGHAELFKREDGVNTIVASRDDLGDHMDPTTWNRMAVRLLGGEVWLLLNDQPLLYAGDVPNQDGGIGIAVVREGNPDDEDEVAVVFRDLALTGLEGPAPGPESDSETETPEPAPNPTLRPSS